MRLTIMQGLPGAGKSSVVAGEYQGWQVVCLDDLRLALGHEFNPGTETMVLAVAEAMVRSHLLGGRDVVVDDTHTRTDNALRWLRMGREYGAEVWLHRVACDLDECVRRREGTAVSREHIERMAGNLARWDLNPMLFDRVIGLEQGECYERLSPLERLNEDGLYAEQAPAMPGMGQLW